MEVIINGERRELSADATVPDALGALGLPGTGVAVAVDGEVDVGDHQPGGVRQERRVDLRAADHPAVRGGGEHLLRRAGPLGALGGPGRVAGEDDVAPPG